MRILILSLLAVLALAVAGCGSSSDSSTGSDSGSLTGQSTCTDWNGATAKDKNAYLAGKDVETGKGSEGDAISAWMDYLCGKTNPSTQYSSLSSIDDVFPAAQQQFTTGSALPPAVKTTTSSSSN